MIYVLLFCAAMTLSFELGARRSPSRAVAIAWSLVVVTAFWYWRGDEFMAAVRTFDAGNFVAGLNAFFGRYN